MALIENPRNRGRHEGSGERPRPASAELVDIDSDTVRVRTVESGKTITFRLIFMDATREKESTENYEKYRESARTVEDFKRCGGDVMLIFPHHLVRPNLAPGSDDGIQSQEGGAKGTTEEYAGRLGVSVEEYLAAKRVALETLFQASRSFPAF